MTISCRRLSATAVMLLVAAAPGSSLGQTQADIERRSCAELKKSELKLSETHLNSLAKNKNDKNLVRKLDETQKRWEAYRSAYLESIYSDPNKNREYGTSYDACRCDILKSMNDSRIKQIEQWTIGIDEGDICVGSRSLKK